MFKLISKIGFVIYLRSFLNLNSNHIKKILFSLFIFLVINYFYSDLQEFLRETNPDKLIYALVFKYAILIPVFIWAFISFMNLRLTEEGLKEKLNSLKTSNKKNSELNKTLENYEMVKKAIEQKEDVFKKYEDIDKYPKLKTRADQLYEK